MKNQDFEAIPDSHYISGDEGIWRYTNTNPQLNQATFPIPTRTICIASFPAPHPGENIYFSQIRPVFPSLKNFLFYVFAWNFNVRLFWCLKIREWKSRSNPIHRIYDCPKFAYAMNFWRMIWLAVLYCHHLVSAIPVGSRDALYHTFGVDLPKKNNCAPPKYSRVL